MALVTGLETITATIASGASLSEATALGAKTLCGIAMPAAWDAAVLTFQVSADGTTWLEMQTTSAAVSYTAAASQYLAFDPAIWKGINLVKVRSGTLGAAVNQTLASAIGLVVKQVM